MLELGPYSDAEHENIIKELQSGGYEHVYLVGEEFGKLKEISDYHFFDRVHELYEHLRKKPVNDSLILLKGSRGIALEKIIGIL
jgi:UDP-N-acetylmuramoyl-tripeptide--D-alanyl-D-alanine ligase